MPVRRGETLTKCLHGDNRNMKARQNRVFTFMLITLKRSNDVYPHTASPYDWQWMFGFLGARAVTGIETVTNDYYERSFACEGHQGIFRVTPDIASHTLSVTLSPG